MTYTYGCSPRYKSKGILDRSGRIAQVRGDAVAELEKYDIVAKLRRLNKVIRARFDGKWFGEETLRELNQRIAEA